MGFLGSLVQSDQCWTISTTIHAHPDCPHTVITPVLTGRSFCSTPEKEPFSSRERKLLEFARDRGKHEGPVVIQCVKLMGTVAYVAAGAVINLNVMNYAIKFSCNPGYAQLIEMVYYLHHRH